MRLYRVTGNIGSYTGGRQGMTLIVWNIDDYDQAPVMLKTGGRIADWINEIEGTDDDEKYAKKRFYYSSSCWLEKIEILDKDGKVIQTIESEF